MLKYHTYQIINDKNAINRIIISAIVKLKPESTRKHRWRN